MRDICLFIFFFPLSQFEFISLELVPVLTTLSVRLMTQNMFIDFVEGQFCILFAVLFFSPSALRFTISIKCSKLNETETETGSLRFSDSKR